MFDKTNQCKIQTSNVNNLKKYCRFIHVFIIHTYWQCFLTPKKLLEIFIADDKYVITINAKII